MLKCSFDSLSTGSRYSDRADKAGHSARQPVGVGVGGAQVRFRRDLPHQTLPHLNPLPRYRKRRLPSLCNRSARADDEKLRVFILPSNHIVFKATLNFIFKIFLKHCLDHLLHYLLHDLDCLGTL